MNVSHKIAVYPFCNQYMGELKDNLYLMLNKTMFRWRFGRRFGWRFRWRFGWRFGSTFRMTLDMYTFSTLHCTLFPYKNILSYSFWCLLVSGFITLFCHAWVRLFLITVHWCQISQRFLLSCNRRPCSYNGLRSMGYPPPPPPPRRSFASSHSSSAGLWCSPPHERSSRALPHWYMVS